MHARENTTYLFVCIQNAGRSQMAAAFARSMGCAARSAGSNPADAIHASVAAAMEEAGLSLAGQTPNKLSDQDIAWADVVVTMGCGDSCPVVPGTTYIDWEIPDPDGMGNEGVRQVRDDLRERVARLIASAS